MPNLKPPITTTEAALEYRERILSAIPDGIDFEPLMTLYLTDKTDREEITKASESGRVFGAKLYPAGATTNSDSGVTDLNNVHGALQAMSDLGMPLLIHGEVTHPDIDVFDKESIFIEQVMVPLVERYPTLKIVMEHITTSQAKDFVLSCGPNVAATITIQHLMFNRNEIFRRGIKPHMYCLPILKREEHRLSLIDAIKSGSEKFFLGTDSAPHAKAAKESSCGCAGIFSAHAAVELYAEIFDEAGALEKFEAFCSENGAKFYNLPFNKGSLTLSKVPWEIPVTYEFGKTELVPLKAGETIQWKITERT